MSYDANKTWLERKIEKDLSGDWTNDIYHNFSEILEDFEGENDDEVRHFYCTAAQAPTCREKAIGACKMIRDDMTNEEYHAHHAVSSSDAKAVLLSSVWHWKNAVQKTSAMQLGTAVHDMALEGGQNTVRGPETRRGNAWKDAVAEAGDKVVLPEKEYDLAQDNCTGTYGRPSVRKAVIYGRCAKRAIACLLPAQKRA